MKPTVKSGRQAFFEEVWSIVALIPEGSVLSYGQVAKLTGRPRNARMVGQALWSSPKELMLPCHRVVNSSGRTAPHWPQQRGLLQEEGVVFRSNGSVEMKLHTWDIVDTPAD